MVRLSLMIKGPRLILVAGGANTESERTRACADALSDSARGVVVLHRKPDVKFKLHGGTVARLASTDNHVSAYDVARLTLDERPSVGIVYIVDEIRDHAAAIAARSFVVDHGKYVVATIQALDYKQARERFADLLGSPADLTIRVVAPVA